MNKKNQAHVGPISGDPTFNNVSIMKEAISNAENLWAELPAKEKKYYNKLAKNHMIKPIGKGFFLSVCLIFGSYHGTDI